MSTPRRLATGAVVLAIALAVAACGGSTASSGSSGATPVPAERTPGPSAAPELAAMLPDKAGGLDFVKSSFTGADVADLGISLDEKQLAALAANNKTTLEGIQVAEARPKDSSKSGIVLAIRVPGADPKTIVDATFAQSASLQLKTVGGKSVYKVASTGLSVVVYLKDDIMFQVVGAPSDLTEAIVAALP